MLKTQAKSSALGGSGLGMGDEQYLWILVILEAAALFMLRGAFRRSHGG